MQQTINKFEQIMEAKINETIKQGFKDGKTKDQIMNDLMVLKQKFKDEVDKI